MGDKARGLYNKFHVERVDGTSAEGGKHFGCEYYVLDLDHDPHAIPALLAYAQSCSPDGYYQLALDLSEKAIRSPVKNEHFQQWWDRLPSRLKKELAEIVRNEG